jgi:uncharacterized protein YyaL (SSP411 family)
MNPDGNLGRHKMLTIEGSWRQFGDNEITNICADMVRFILREICHEDGEFFDKEGVLTLDDAERLRRWVS